MIERKLVVDVVIGSISDLKYCREALLWLSQRDAVELRVHVISCHRHPRALLEYVVGINTGNPVDAIIAGAGWAAHLPGMLKTDLTWFYRPTPVIGVGFPGGTPKRDMAARRSIDQLPGQPVIVKKNGTAFFGSMGMIKAAELAVSMPQMPINRFPYATHSDIVRSLPCNPATDKPFYRDFDWRAELAKQTPSA